jgi:hypothetical protein
MQTRTVIGVMFLTSLCASVTTLALTEGPRAMHNFGGTCSPSSGQWCLGTVSVVRQMTASEGGPQALEGYTIVDTRGTVRLAHGTIGNIEQAGSGDLSEARPLQSGGVVSGTGRVHRWTGLFIDRPKTMGTNDPAPNVIDYRAIQFSNGLFLTPDVDPKDGKPILKLCTNDPRDAPCVILKP